MGPERGRSECAHTDMQHQKDEADETPERKVYYPICNTDVVMNLNTLPKCRLQRFNVQVRFPTEAPQPADGACSGEETDDFVLQ